MSAKKAKKRPKKTAKKALKKRLKKRIIKKRPSKPRPVKKRLSKKRPAKKKSVKRQPPRKKSATKFQQGVIGVVTHYFPRVRAAAIKLKAPLSAGETVRIKGHTTDFTQVVNSLQIERRPIMQGKKGQEIGLLVSSRVRHNDLVFKA